MVVTFHFYWTLAKEEKIDSMQWLHHLSFFIIITGYGLQ